MQFEEKFREFGSKAGNDSSANIETLSPTLEKSIENIIRKEGYITSKKYERIISTEGGNYVGILWEVDVNGKTADGDKEINIFIKNIIPSDKTSFFSVNDVYATELFAYTQLGKIYKELQDKADVPLAERFNMVKSYDESFSEAIILENLSKKGFNTCHRMDVIPLKFAELSIKRLATFHALSHVLEKRRPQYFEYNIKPLISPMKFNEDWKKFTRNLTKMMTKNLNHDSKKKMGNFSMVFINKFPKYITDTSLPGTCLCHGDYRANNILMKETDGEVTEVIPVDYQVLHYGCPLNDFIYFIFSSTDQQFRKKHLTDLKNMYYDTLSRFLKYFDIDVNDIYPRKQFETQYRERLDYGLLVAIFVLPFCFADKDDLPDFSKDDMTNVNFKLDIRVQERIQGIVDDFIDWGYL